MNRDPYPLPCTQAAGVALLPVAARRTAVQKVGVYVDESRYASSSSTKLAVSSLLPMIGDRVIHGRTGPFSNLG